VNNKQIV